MPKLSEVFFHSERYEHGEPIDWVEHIGMLAALLLDAKDGLEAQMRLHGCLRPGYDNDDSEAIADWKDNAQILQEAAHEVAILLHEGGSASRW